MSRLMNGAVAVPANGCVGVFGPSSSNVSDLLLKGVLITIKCSGYRVFSQERRRDNRLLRKRCSKRRKGESGVNFQHSGDRSVDPIYENL